MTANTKTIPVFVNSTFRDLTQERTLLVERVFPCLNERFEKNGVHLEQIDLKFGTSGSEMSPEAMLEVFGSELNRGSLIVCLLGDRFGWIPPREYDSVTALGVYSALASRSSQLVILRRSPELTNALAAQFGTETFREPSSELAVEQQKLLRRLEWLAVPIHTYRSLEDADDGFVKTAAREIEKAVTKTALNKHGTVFISYSRCDIDIADRFCDALEVAGFNVWLDKKGIALGDDWPEKLAKAINDCDAVLMLVSESSVHSEYTLREVLYAMKRKKPILAYHLGAVTLPDKVELLLGTVQHLEENTFGSFEAALAAIAAGLREQIGKSAKVNGQPV